MATEAPIGLAVRAFCVRSLWHPVSYPINFAKYLQVINGDPATVFHAQMFTQTRFTEQSLDSFLMVR